MPIDRPTIRAIVFDLDDTLYAERDYVASGYRAVEEHLRRVLGRREPLAAWLWERFQAGRSKGAFDALNDHFRLGLDAAGIQELVEVYRRHRPSITPYEGMAELLLLLGGRFRLGLLTDGYLPAQRLKLDALALGGFFEKIVFTEELGRHAWKPSPEGFQAIREAMESGDSLRTLGIEPGLSSGEGSDTAPRSIRRKLSPDSFAYVADNPAKDFVAPNCLGWLTIQWVRPLQIYAAQPPPPEGAPQRVVLSVEELLAALEQDE